MKFQILLTPAVVACALLSFGAKAQTVITPPYTLNLADENERNQYTIIDANNDGYTWGGSKYYFRCNTTGTNKADDWLISPAIAMKEGSTYTITYIGHNKQSDKPERVELKAGTAPTAEAMTLTVMPTITFTTVQKETNTATFVAPTTGNYYFGFHCTSKAGMYYAYVDGWAISAAVDKACPDSVKSLTVTPGAKGALSATVSFSAPSASVGGDALTALTSATVINMTTGEVAGTVSNPTPGAALSVEDANPKKNAFNRYRVYVTSDKGVGVSSDAQAYVGIDIPKAVGRGNWTQQGNNVVLTWPAVSEVGVNGGYVDPAAVTYTVTMLQPSYTDLAKGVSGTTYTDASLAETSGQTFASYAITPKSEAGEGQGSPTFSGPFGTPYDVPATESFADVKLAYSPWFIIDYAGGDDSSWDVVASSTYPSRTPQDGDGGFAMMRTDDDGRHMLSSPMFKLGTDNVLTFWISNPDRYNSFELKISDDQCHNWTKLATLPVTKEAWEKQTFDLSAYNGKTVCLGFCGEVESYNRQICVDNISISEGRTGVAQVTTDDIYVSVAGDQLTVTADGQTVSVFDTTGRLVATAQSVTGTATFTLPQGAYIVRTAQRAAKVVIR